MQKQYAKLPLKPALYFLVMYCIVHLQNKSSTWKENYVNCIGIMYPLCKYSRVAITSQQEAATAFRPLSLTKVSFLTHFFLLIIRLQKCNKKFYRGNQQEVFY